MRKKFSHIKPRGWVVGTAEYFDGRPSRIITFQNNVLDGGREYHAKSLAQGKGQPAFISHMLFGDGGVESGQTKKSDVRRTELFGVTRVRKEVTAHLDTEDPKCVAFTATIERDEGNDYPISEMALQMSDGRLYSLVAHPEYHKTDMMKLSWMWLIRID